MEINITVDVRRVRNLAKSVRGTGFTTQQAQAFLALYGDDLTDYLLKRLAAFVRGRLEAEQ